jgi:hypothetical protein
MSIMDHPLLVFVTSFLLMWLAARLGTLILRKWLRMEPDTRKDFATILATTLTLNGLIIGFTFSMAIGRYEQRKNYEEAEANAIGTEFVRADLLATADAAAAVRSLLRAYLDERVAFYMAHDAQQIRLIMARTAQLQTQLWATVAGTGAAQPTAVGALAISGMNDVLNSQGYTQAAWWNRIPSSAWILMAAIAVISHVLVGYGAQRTRHASTSEGVLMTVLPLVVAISFLLIADIDSPRSGIIRVKPQNLTSLAEALRAP